MKNQNQISQTNLVFSRWTRKKYAAFVSLKKVVKIAQLSVDVCVSLAGKINSFVLCVEAGTGKLILNSLTQDGDEILYEEVLELVLTTEGYADFKEDCINKKLIDSINQSPLFAMQVMDFLIYKYDRCT